MLAGFAGLIWCGVASAAPLVLHLTEAKPSRDPATGETVLLFRMTEETSKAFAELTAANIGRTMELRIDGKPVFAPIIREPVTNATGQVSGGLSDLDLNEIAKRLMAGTSVIEVEVIPAE